MKKTGKNLERLIAALERTLSNKKSVKIEAPKRLRDKVTGKLREHDVVLTVTQGHHSFLIAIECRDRSRPITDEQIGAFFRKCHDTGIDQGVIVSSNGFYNTARTKAEHLGVRCLDIEEVESFSWLLTSAFHVIKPKLLHTDWMFYSDSEPASDMGDFEILDASGAIISKRILTANAQQQLNRLLQKQTEPVEAGELIVRFEGGGLILRDIASGGQVPVNFAIAKIKYSVTQDSIPFRLFRYKDKDASIADAAVVQFNFGERSGNIMMIYKEGKGGQIVFVPDRKKQKRSTRRSRTTRQKKRTP